MLITTKNNGKKKTDRFSDLSDDILHHIFSFLHDTKPAVQTSVLSKRWKYLWKDLPALHLHEASFLTRGSLRGFVRNFLSLRSRQHAILDNVSLSYTHKEEDVIRSSSDVRTETHDLLHTVFRYTGVRVLFIRNLHACAFYDVVTSIVVHNRHDHLEVLELVGCSRISLSFMNDMANYFGMLTTLDLRDCGLEFHSSRDINDGDPFAKLGRLKCLKLVGCRLHPTRFHLKLSGQQLRNVHIVDCSTVLVSQVVAPKLESFVFSCDVQGRLLVNLHSLDLPSLCHARIRLWMSDHDETSTVLDDDPEVVTHAVTRLLRALRNAKSLDLCLEDTSSCDPQDSHFTRMKPMIETEVCQFTRLETLRIRYPQE